MKTGEIIILVIAALPLLYRAWKGWRFGAATEIHHLLVNFFGVLVAIRYWQPWSETVSGGLTFDPRWIALSSFVLLYGLGALVAGFVVKLGGQGYQSVKPDFANKGLGVLVGIGSGVILGISVLWLAQIAKPGSFETAPGVQTAVGVPRGVVQTIETVVGVAPDSSGRTRYPHVTIEEVPAGAADGATAPAGAVLMQQRGRVAWQP